MMTKNRFLFKFFLLKILFSVLLLMFFCFCFLRLPDFYHTCYTLSGLSIAQHFAVGNIHHKRVVGHPSNELVSLFFSSRLMFDRQICCVRISDRCSFLCSAFSDSYIRFLYHYLTIWTHATTTNSKSFWGDLLTLLSTIPSCRLLWHVTKKRVLFSRDKVFIEWIFICFV